MLIYFIYWRCTTDLASGHGEWEDSSETRCRILWRKPEQLASDIYDWAEANGYINSVCTVYELHSGGSISHFICAVILFWSQNINSMVIFNC